MKVSQRHVDYGLIDNNCGFPDRFLFTYQGGEPSAHFYNTAKHALFAISPWAQFLVGSTSLLSILIHGFTQ